MKEGIESGYFEDGPRMERLDVGFAGRYLAALEQFRRGERPSDSWSVAFEAAGARRLSIPQQLRKATSGSAAAPVLSI